MTQTPFRSSLLTVGELAAVMLCFTLNSVITRYLVLADRFSPFALTVVRFVSGLIMLLILARLKPEAFQGREAKNSYFWGALFLGVYAFAISFGYAFITASSGVLVFYAFVVATMTLFSVLRDKEKPTLRLISGQLSGLAGVLLITFGGIESVTWQGVLLMAVTGVAWGLHSVLARRFENSFAYSLNTFFIFGTIALILSLAVYPFGGSRFWTGLSAAGLGLAIFMGAVTTALSYILWHGAMKKIRASQGGIVQLLVPVLTGLLGVFLLGEEITLSLMLGGALVLLGISLHAWPGTS